MNTEMTITFDDDFQSCARTYATLCIYPGIHNPDEVTKMLQLQPSRVQYKDQLLPGHRNKIAKINGWFLGSNENVKSKDLRRHLNWLLGKIRDKEQKLLQLRLNDYEIRVLSFWESTHGNGGPILDYATMRELGNLQIDLHFDIWFNFSEAED
jgi:hypothetical protein